MSRSVLVTLDRERHLRYTINALADLEQHLGTGLGGVMLTGKVGIGFMRGFLWAGLKHEDARLSVERAGQLLQDYLDRGGDLASLANSMNEAMQIAGFGRTREDAGSNGNGAAPSLEDGPGPFPGSTSGMPTPSA